MELPGKSIFVTGATDGIGARLARQLRDKGAQVIVHGRNPARLAAARAEGYEVVEGDLSRIEGVEAVLAQLDGRVIDGLINNAGAGADYDFRDGTPDPAAAEATIFLNLTAPIRLITGLMPVLLTRPEAMIVNVTSGLAIAPRAGGPVYCATKAGVRRYTQALRAQLAGTQVRVVEALPPVVDTQLTAGRGNRKMAPEECARQIVAGMERNVTEVNVGMVKVLQLVHSISPALARRIMLKF